jgi:hypothetical protein
MRTRTIFTSRWWALVWAAGIIWLAHDFISDGNTGPSETSAASNISDDAQIAQLTNMVDRAKSR